MLNTVSMILYCVPTRRHPDSGHSTERVLAMVMSPPLRKTLLALHVVASVGWLGSVAAFLVLSLLAAYGSDPETVRSAYVSMDPVGWWAVVPLDLLALLTGFALALATPWGLLRHYWVATKLVLTILGTGLLLMHQTMVVQQVAALASSGAPLADGSLHHMGVQLAWTAGFGLLLLVTLTALSVFKPWGLTKSALRRQSGGLAMPREAAPSLPTSLKLFYAAVAVSLFTFMMLHMPGHMHHHG